MKQPRVMPMSWNNAFWFCAGALVAAGLAFIVPTLWRAALAGFSRRAAFAITAGIAVAFAALSVLLYRSLGNPLDPASVENATSVHAASMRAATGQASESLSDAARKLAARLAEQGGSDSDWELLAQSYDYMGDSAAASAARAKRASAPANPQSATGSDEEMYRQRVAQNPRDAQAWLALARMQRSARRFADAKVAYERLVALGAMDADAWADYADVLASSSGTLKGASAAAVAKALTLDSKHTKALWLHASLAMEEHRYQDARAGWQRLRKLIADTSPDAAIVDANIHEADALAAGKSAGSAQNTMPIAIRGVVDIDSRLKAGVTPGMVLFVFARSVDASGPPVAVLRTPVSAWPVKFQLDDSLAMLPDRMLSGFDKVRIEARLSRSGQAAAQPGDLQAEGSVISTRDAREVTLRISRPVS